MEQAAVYQQPLLFDCPTALLWQSCASSKVDALPFPGLLEYLPSEYSNKTTADQQQQQQQQHKQYQEWIPQSFPFGFIETRRRKSSFTDAQREVLDYYFFQHPRLRTQEIKEIQKHTGLTQRQIRTYFQNKRSRYRRAMRRKDHVDDQKLDCITPEHDID